MTNGAPVAAKRAVWDVVLTIILLVLTGVTLLVSAFADLFALAFTDYCPASCNSGAGVAVVLVVWLVSAAVALAGMIFSIVRLRRHRHRRAWWISLITLAAVITGGVAGFWLYTVIVGY
jgi:uncharacterized BrkB/YihY/UPF0761 family membrane protein